MIATNDLESLTGHTVTGQDGQKIGKIVDVYESTEGTDGTFVTVSTGMFGGHASFVPLAKATLQGKTVTVPYDKALIKDAPRVEADQELTAQDEDRLHQHYSLRDPASRAAAPAPTGTKTVGRDTSGPTTDDAMTRSEERLQVGTQQQEAGRARLRKRIVTEQVSQTVAVSHQSATVTREPITEANMPAAMDGPALSEEEHEVVMLDEVPVVSKETVAVERVRMGTETVTEQREVSEQVRKEVIELDEDTDAPRAATTGGNR